MCRGLTWACIGLTYTVDIEWSPRQSSSVTTPSAIDETQPNKGTSFTSAFDELDPFANWPPRPATSVASTSFNNGTASGFSKAVTQFKRANNDNWAFSNAPLSSLKPPQQGNQDPINSFGLPKQSQGISSFNNGSYNSQKPADISSISGSSKTKQTVMKLAPPPSIAIGRERGRGGTGTLASKPNSSQQSILDLL